MKVRSAKLEDLSRIVDIEGLCFPQETAFPQGMFAYLIRYAKTLVALEDGEIAGFIIGFSSGRVGIVYTLDVHPKYRKRGIGRMLIGALEEDLSASGARAVRLEAALDNPAALELYERAGYQKGELVKNYYGQGKHALRMWKILKD